MNCLQAYEELHGKLEVMWGERDEALVLIQRLRSEKENILTRALAQGLVL